MELAVLLSIFALILVFFHLIKQIIFLKSRQLPGPLGLPIIGNLHQFDSENPHEYLFKLSRKYGPLMQLKLGYRQIVVISSASAAKEALKNQGLVFSGRPTLLGSQRLCYNGRDLAFSPYEEYHKEIRKICVLHLFSMKRVQCFRPILIDEISLAVQEISNLSSDSQVIDLSSLMLNLTSSFTCRVAFGKKFDKRTRQKKRFDEMLKEGQAMLAGFFVSDYIPWLSCIDRISGMKDRLEKSFKDFDSFNQELIDEHVDPNRPETMKGNILDIFIGLKEQQLPGFDLTWDHIKALLVDIFIAGSDTSAATMVWVMTALIKKPLIMKRVQTEIRKIIGKKDIIDGNDIERLVYFKAIVKEAMRLYPAVPLLLPKETTTNCIIEGYDIKAKTLVFVNDWAISRDPGCWKNPGEFNPERFMNCNIDVKGNDFEVIPFGAGRRICPAMDMGLATVELTLANLLNTFDWELPSGIKIEDINTNVLPGLTMHKKDALCLVADKFN